MKTTAKELKRLKARCAPAKRGTVANRYITHDDSVLDLISDIEEQAGRIRELEAIVDKLPKTADGVAISFDTELWHWIESAGAYQVRKTIRIISSTAITFEGDKTASLASDFYSTREAAEAKEKP